MTDSLQLGFDALAQTAGTPDHRSLIDKLIPIARSLANQRGEDGVTVADVRTEAVRQGLLPRKAKGREYAFLGALMRKAGLIPTESFRRSDIDDSHGNLQRVWIRRA